MTTIVVLVALWVLAKAVVRFGPYASAVWCHYRPGTAQATPSYYPALTPPDDPFADTLSSPVTGWILPPQSTPPRATVKLLGSVDD
jgi:hypothetical protein